ncbi:type II secretion system protein [Rubritalea sp.]|uniref:type II secretion system protein n=1 Tax=Rubritalea sp. TaxID=2109375 RepID=UPI003EF0ED18
MENPGVMMTLVHKTRFNSLPSPRRGFTLLEIVVTMMIISVLLGSAALFFVGSSDEDVENLSRDTQRLAKKTMRSARDEQRAYSLFISPKSIWSEPEMIDLEYVESRPNEIQIDEDITVSYLLDEESGWQRVSTNDTPFVWSFSQTGLCEPISLRFENDVAVDEVTFHPLTAGKLIDEN